MSLNANQIPVYSITPKTGVGVATNATGAGTLGSDTNGVTIFTASASGSRVYSLVANTSDSAANNVLIYILSGASVRPLGVVNVPINSGNLGTIVNVDCLNPAVMNGMPIDNTGKRYIELGANEVLKFAVLTTAVTATKSCFLTCQAADYQ
jgi:hypothetical protein